MVDREVEAVEVVARGLDLAAVHDPVAEPEEDVLDLPPDLRDQVEVAARRRLSWERDVEHLLGEAAVEVGALELCLALGDLLLELLPERVEDAARLGVANLAERLLQLALPAEVADARVVELGERRSGRNGASRLGFQRPGVHRVSVSSPSCRPTTPSPASTTRSQSSTTRGAGASRRTSTFTSPRRGRRAGRSSSSASERAG